MVAPSGQLIANELSMSQRGIVVICRKVWILTWIILHGTETLTEATTTSTLQHKLNVESLHERKYN